MSHSPPLGSADVCDPVKANRDLYVIAHGEETML